MKDSQKALDEYFENLILETLSISPMPEVMDYTTIGFRERKRYEFMSQGVFFKNINGIVAVADTAKIDYNPITRMMQSNSTPLQKVYYDKKLHMLWITVGITGFEEGIKMALQNTQIPIKQRLHNLGNHIAQVIETNKYKYSYMNEIGFELFLGFYENSLNTHYLRIENGGVIILDGYDVIKTVVGLYTEKLYTMPRVTKDSTLKDMLKQGITIVKKAIELDKSNDNIYVGGNIQWITMDGKGNIITNIS